MKDTHILATACGLALIAIVCVFVGYVTDTLPQQSQRVITTSRPITKTMAVTEKNTDTSGEKKKDCSCCATRTSVFSEQMDRYIQRKKASASKIAREGK